MMIDNGVFEKIFSGNQEILAQILEIQTDRVVTVCAAQAGELLFNGQDNKSSQTIYELLISFPELVPPTKDEVLAAHITILDRFPRSIQTVDTYMTAYALKNDCCIVTFDKHFLLAKELFPQLEVHRLTQPS